MSGSRNRTAGHNFERQIVNELKAIGFKNAVSARSESRNTDDKGIDICHTPGYQIQCKNSKLNPDYTKILTAIPDGDTHVNVVIHRKTKKANTRFITQGDYVVLKKSDFYNLLIKANEPR
jgi:hypothetical protein